MFQNIAVVVAVIIAIAIFVKALIDIKASNEALNDDSSEASYKVEPTEVGEDTVAEDSYSAPAEPIASLQEPIRKPKRKSKKPASE